MYVYITPQKYKYSAYVTQQMITRNSIIIYYQVMKLSSVGDGKLLFSQQVMLMWDGTTLKFPHQPLTRWLQRDVSWHSTTCSLSVQRE